MLRRVRILSVAAVGLLALTGMTPVMAAEGSALTADEEQQVRLSMDELGIAPEDQDSILSRMADGVLPESLVGESEPVEVETFTDGQFNVERFIFADGSRSETRVEVPQEAAAGGISPMLSACTIPHGPYPTGYSFSNCSVQHSTVGLNMSFSINGRTAGHTSSYPPRITGHSPFYINVAAGHVTHKEVYVDRPVGSLTWGAFATGHAQVNIKGQIGSVTAALRAHVRADVWASLP